MSHNFLKSSSFHAALYKIDQELAEQVRQKNCPYCQGRLHQANYPRVIYGLASNLRSFYATRFSFCCNRCRKRTTPGSVRFFSRFRFAFIVILLVCATKLRINQLRLSQLQHRIGHAINERTLKRWRSWWQKYFMHTKFWCQNKSQLTPPINKTQPLPRQILSEFSDTLEEKCLYALKWLSPITQPFCKLFEGLVTSAETVTRQL